jgi:hypothetical protein
MTEKKLCTDSGIEIKKVYYPIPNNEAAEMPGQFP